MKHSAQPLFMSVVICSYNGAAVLGRAIESLLAQDYPRDRYEIIVVDDGSRDQTAAVAGRYPVRLVRHGRNRGLAAARNTGLEHVKGDIYVSFDDDCVVKPDWLRRLAEGYEQPKAAGVGSLIQEPAVLHGIVDRFMAATGSGNPPSLRLGAHKSILGRFVAYIVDQLRPEQPGTEIYPVRQLNGATATFAVELLRSVGGWDAALRAAEDTDLAARIHKAYPDHHFYAVPGAWLIHDPKMSLRTFLRRPYVRGLSNLIFYRRNGLTPPVFPFPLAWTSAVGLSLILGPFWSLLVAIVLPQMLYAWWPVGAVRERNLWYLSFAYMQLAEEWSTIAGLVRGYVLLKKGGDHAQA
jgi:glycosyltransferase involved in cell wall biosynthesis